MSEVFNIFDKDNLVLEFSNSDLNASLISNEKGFLVKGTTTQSNDKIHIVWNTKDTINHGYCRYTTLNTLAGTNLSFKISNIENILPYTDIYNKQYLVIVDNKDKEYIVPLGSLGKAVSFKSDYTIKEQIVINNDENNDSYVITLNEKWILNDKTFSIKFITSDGDIKELIPDIDYKIDFEIGTVEFKKDNIIPVNTKVTIRGFKHSSDEYVIKFSTLRDINNEVVVVDNIKSVKIPISIDNEIKYNNNFTLEITDWSVSRGGLTWIKPTELKKHNIKLVENYTYTRNLNPRRLVYNIEKLGYEEKLILHLGDGEFLNLNTENITEDIFNIGFINWYTDLIEHSKTKGFKSIDIIIPNYNKYLNHCCQQLKDGTVVPLLNPLLDEIKKYYSYIIYALVELSNDITINFIIENLKWGCFDGELSIFNKDVVNLFEKETGLKYLDGTGNVEDYKEITENTKKVCDWLSKQLLNTLMELTCISEIQLAQDIGLLFSDNIYFLINNFFDKYLNHTQKMYVINNDVASKYSNNDILNRTMEVLKTENKKTIAMCISGIDDKYLNGDKLDDLLDATTKLIEEAKYELGLDVLIFTGLFVRESSYFLFNPLAYVELTKVDTNYEITLCKANKEVLAVMSNANLISISRKVDDIDEVSIRIPYYVQDTFSHNRIKNHYYDSIKTERLICLNGKEYFVIKEITETIGDEYSMNISCYSLEHKLSKRPVVFTKGQSLQLYSDDKDMPDGIFNLLEAETGWKVGYINEECRFELIDGALKTKYRYFEEINTTWYTFLMDEVSILFDCLFQFNTNNKTINIYPNTVLGADSGLFLTEDNYIKSIEKIDNTNEIVTRLSLIGRNEIDIYEVNPLGTDYVENFEYFIDNGEMSKELVYALKEYYRLIEALMVTWTEKNSEYLEKKNLQGIYKYDIQLLQSQITYLEKILAEYEEQGDKDNADRIREDINKLKEEKKAMEDTLSKLDIDVPKLKEEIKLLSLKMSRESILDENGELLFTNDLLSELQEFIYHDTYSDDSFTTAQGLYNCGTNVLKDMSKPTTDYTLDLVNFLQRVGHKRFWKGELHLRDVVLLQSNRNNKKIELFVVGFTYNPDEKTIDIELSNKITNKNSTKTIAEILKIAKETSKLVNINKYLWAKLKEEEEIKNS